MHKAETSSADRAVRGSLGLKTRQELGRIRDEAGETEQRRALRTTKTGRDGVAEDPPFRSLPLMPHNNPTPMPMFGCCPRSNGDTDTANCHSITVASQKPTSRRELEDGGRAHRYYGTRECEFL